MLVRAAAAIPCGEEVLITYCGSAVGAPVGVRRQALQQGWGFRCECSRCLVDQDYEQEPLGQALLAGYQKLVSKLRPGLLAALDTHDRAAVTRHVKQVANLMEELQARLREMPDELDKAVLSGSVLPLCLDMLILTDMQRLVASHVENKLADALADALASKHEQVGKR
ncbi:predicted protein [Haematococcus lacustris]|uniref:SET domain-containing protein n=1 Tax=Haematococcus lacustris TaxID=44745 RepID=A0A6A0ADU7_HAELA|nr:predicted protein [Haematococcus lacustris]